MHKKILVKFRKFLWYTRMFICRKTKFLLAVDLSATWFQSAALCGRGSRKNGARATKSKDVRLLYKQFVILSTLSYFPYNFFSRKFQKNSVHFIFQKILEESTKSKKVVENTYKSPKILEHPRKLQNSPRFLKIKKMFTIFQKITRKNTRAKYNLNFRLHRQAD